MKLAILGPGENASAYTTKRLIEEARKEMKVIQIPLVDVELKIDKKLDALYKKESLIDFDYILPRVEISPENENDLPAIWCFCSSPFFHEEVRKVDQKLNVTNATCLFTNDSR